MVFHPVVQLAADGGIKLVMLRGILVALDQTRKVTGLFATIGRVGWPNRVRISSESRSFLGLVLFASGLCAGSIHAADPQVSPRPNIITIVGDDIGWGDVGFHGSPNKTPNIALLAAAGPGWREMPRARGIRTPALKGPGAEDLCHHRLRLVRIAGNQPTCGGGVARNSA